METGVILVHKEGKNKRTMGPTTVRFSQRLERIIAFFVGHVRHHLRKSSSPLLLPGLNPNCVSGLDEAFGVAKGHLTEMMSGNCIRQFHTSLTLELTKVGRLSEGDVRRAAFYRRHSLAVAEKEDDMRHQATEDANIQHDVLAAARLWLQESANVR